MADVDFKVVKPNAIIEMEAKKMYAETYTLALDQGAVPRDNLEDYLVKKNLLSKDHLQMMRDIVRQIEDLLEPLSTGGIKLKEMEERARKASSLRVDLYKNTAHKQKYDYLTAESKAEDAQFTYYIFSCFRKPDGSKYWATYKDFIECVDAGLVELASNEVAKVLYGEEEFNIIKMFAETPENQFLIKYNFIDESLEDVDKKEVVFAPFTDDEGNPITPKE